MEVKLSTNRGDAWDGVLRASIVLAIVAALLAPGFFVPTYFRWVMTVIFVLLGLLVVRGYITAFAALRRPPAPPPAPEGAELPTVSVLVVAYNEATVLPRSMAAMQRVDYPKDKIRFIYVYEKRSTDATGEIIRSFAARDPRFVPVERDDKRGGKAAACNHGLDHCKGEILVSLDADQALAPNAVRRAVQWFQSDPAIACVKGRPIAINSNESYLALAAKLERDVIEKGDLYMRDVVGGFTFFGGGQAFFRRGLFETLGRFDEEVLIEDIDYSIKIHQSGQRILVDPEIHSFEEHPAAFRAWWAQRKRWSRGWMQMTRRYLPKVFRMENVPWPAKVDLAHTLAYVIIPLAFTLSLPINVLRNFGHEAQTFVPYEQVWWTIFGLTPFAIWFAVWIGDKRDGVAHPWRELVGLATFGFYMSVLAIATWSAFVDEFILRRPSVYVKTAKTGGTEAQTSTDAAFAEA